MRNKTRPAGIAAMGLGLLATLLFLAGPAAADMHDHGRHARDDHGRHAPHDHSLGADASNGSVTSGAAQARNGSVASGCAEAVNGSTASGGVCPKKVEKEHVKEPEHHKKKVHHDRGKVHHGVGGAAPAHAVQTRALAVTGPTTVPLALAGAALLGLGGLLVVLTSDRRRTPLAVQ